MTITYLKKATAHRRNRPDRRARRCRGDAGRDRAGGDDAVRRYAADLDKWQGEIVMSPEASGAGHGPGAAETAATTSALPTTTSAALPRRRRRRSPIARSRLSPACAPGSGRSRCRRPGCYVPGGRYSHIASAHDDDHDGQGGRCAPISPPVRRRARAGHPGADASLPWTCAGRIVILNLGGVQGVAAMANGLFGLPARRYPGRPRQPVCGRGQAHPVTVASASTCSRGRPTAW